MEFIFYICHRRQSKEQILINKKKKMRTYILAITLAFISMSMNARGNALESLTTIEDTYMEQVLKQHVLATSSVIDKDLLMTSFLLENQKKFNTADIMTIKQQLDLMSDKQIFMINSVDFKDPTVALVFSVLVGVLGIDRFYIGDTGLGVLKLITGGGLGVWWLVDMFVISDKTKKNNVKEFQETIVLQEALAK